MSHYSITLSEQYRLRKIAKRLSVQSEEHERNIVKYFEIMCEMAEEEFREDNRTTLNGFLRDCFEKALPLIRLVKNKGKK